MLIRALVEQAIDRELTKEEVSVLVWLNGWEESTSKTVMRLILEANAAGSKPAVIESAV